MASAFNNKIDEILYKCRKLVIKPNLTQRLCKWDGSLGDYINHIKVEHPKSYFEIKNKSKFSWKLPYKQDQTDIGVIQNHGGYFLYEIYYNYKTEKILFSMTCIKKLASRCSKVYLLSILNDNIENENLGYVQFESEELFKEITEQQFTIFIDKIKFVIDRNITFVIKMH